MKRRLNLAVGLVHRPRLLLLDEPTVGVDPHSREHIFQIVETLRDDGTTILYTTHYMEEAERLCDRLGIMDEGKIIAIGSLEQLLAERELFGDRRSARPAACRRSTRPADRPGRVPRRARGRHVRVCP